MKVTPEQVKEDLLLSEVCRANIWFATGLLGDIIVVPSGSPVDLAVTCPGKLPRLSLIRDHPVRRVLPKEKSPAADSRGESSAGYRTLEYPLGAVAIGQKTLHDN